MRTAVVTGDVTIDWNLARSQVTLRKGALWDPEFISRCYRQVGGAGLLGELISAAAEPLGHTINRIKLAPRKRIVPSLGALSHSYTICTQYPKHRDETAATAWRVKEFLGVDKPVVGANENQSLTVLKDDGLADLIIIDDANQAFRRSQEDTWPLSLREPKDSAWVLLKLARPDFTETNLFGYLRRKFAGRILLVLTVNELRALKLRISRELSWERAIYDLMTEFRNILDGLPEIGKCVVSFYTEGAVFLPNPNDGQDVQLYYDPHSIEGTWGADYPGKMVGYTQCLTAGIALSFLQSGHFDDLGPGILAGLSASRLLHEWGFTAQGDPLLLPEKLYFPTQNIAEELKSGINNRKTLYEKSEFSEQSVNYDQEPHWTILQSQYPAPADVVKLAVSIVGSGPDETLRRVPVAKFGDFISLERDEIEGMRQIRALISEYKKAQNQERPLSIAVFGAPGSGKSFAISSVAKSLSPSGTEDIKQFNLSQFASPTELLGAFHQIRDAALKGKIPLVFWDEFDSQLNGHELGWIRYFLAPMQDGTFQHGELTHPIGKSIFVFAGGTSPTLKGFEKVAKDNVQAKGPDFLSRLKGYADIAGLDHKDDRLNPNVVIRRALLLRSTLLKAAPDIVQYEGAVKKIQVDPGVLNAFLFLKEYKHGIRSLESVIRMSFLTGKSSFDRSSLPAESQIELHVDPEEFSDLVKTDEIPTPDELRW